MPYLVAAANTHLVATARRERRFAAAMEKFDLIVPDGMPLVWYLNRMHDARLKDRVYGPDLMRHLLAVASPADRHFLLGGEEEERKKLEQILRREFPQARVMGSYSPPFGEWPSGENEKIIRLLRDVEPNFVWVGLGCPKQELLLAGLKGSLPPAVYVAVGAAFSLISGTVKPPSCMAESGNRMGIPFADGTQATLATLSSEQHPVYFLHRLGSAPKDL
jgi:N-acetylglucosaminyldiphosphoundecaprenol N-acetyl-beta-D-mannosaminyltransferase